MSHRDEGVTFDLVPDDDSEDEVALDPPGGGAPRGPGIVRRAGRAVRAFLARQPPRRLVAAGVAVAVVAGSSVGISTAVGRTRAAAAERDRVTALLASPGGVRDLSAPLTAAWTVPLTGDLMGRLPGTLVVQDGADAVGLRVEDGSEAWRHELGGDLVCGPQLLPGERAPTPKQLVCLAGPREARRVTVLDAAGAVAAQRDLGDTRDQQLTPGPDGSLVVVRRTGEAPDIPKLVGEDALTTLFPDGLTAGQGADLTVTDAATGAVRWAASIPFVPVTQVQSCGLSFDLDGGYHLLLDVAVEASQTAVQVEGCGVYGAYLPDGVSLPPAPPGDGQPYRQTEPDGGFAIDGGGASSLWVDGQGRQEFVSAAHPVSIAATDGLSEDTLVRTDDGFLAALGPDGTPRWVMDHGTGAPADLPWVVARAGGVYLTLAADQTTLAAVSEKSGKVLWRSDLPVVAQGWVAAGVTDGRTTVLAVSVRSSDGPTAHVADAEGAVQLVGVDLRTGATWTVERAGTSVQLLAVEGSVVEYATANFRQLRDVDSGETATYRDGTLSLLVPDHGPDAGAQAASGWLAAPARVPRG
ncbi:hypothetical protein [Xylanimonas sp. McL0601]|uniref:hypothetical protein n=1 Tax=Xylanimonas sp. McL0601 TaxID=3414739 RepID=UPI003CED87D9